jgi:hypothetical protein
MITKDTQARKFSMHTPEQRLLCLQIGMRADQLIGTSVCTSNLRSDGSMNALFCFVTDEELQTEYLMHRTLRSLAKHSCQVAKRIVFIPHDWGWPKPYIYIMYAQFTNKMTAGSPPYVWSCMARMVVYNSRKHKKEIYLQCFESRYSCISKRTCS